MKRIPSLRRRNVTGSMDSHGEYHQSETNTDYLNKHAEEWKAPLGSRMHLHLIFARTVHWRVVDRASSVCKIPGRCHRVFIAPAFMRRGD